MKVNLLEVLEPNWVLWTQRIVNYKLYIVYLYDYKFISNDV